MNRLLVPLMLGLVACQPRAADLTEQRKAEIAAEVNALNAEYWEAWRAADWDRGMAYYVDSPDFVWAAGGVVHFGLNVLEEARPGFANVASQMFAFRDSRIIVMAPDAASVTATGTWAQTDSAGVTGPARDFAWTAVWVLRDGGWKIQLVHMSYPVPGPQAM
jgi:uncharacterized protein (TIGR02246 family)